MKKSILIIEDDHRTLEVLAEVLQLKYGVPVYAASTGEEGLDIFKTYFPDIVILDICMPGIDGFEMAKKMRKMNPEVHLVVLTASMEERYLHLFKLIGCEDFVQKPALFDKLFAAIERAHPQ